MVVGLSVWTSLRLYCKVRHCVRVVCMLTDILVVPSFVLWTTTILHGPGEHEGGAAEFFMKMIEI